MCRLQISPLCSLVGMSLSQYVVVCATCMWGVGVDTCMWSCRLPNRLLFVACYVGVALTFHIIILDVDHFI